MSDKKILIIGSANIDLSMNMFRVPASGETLIDDGGVAYTPGGKGANAALAFKKLGGSVTGLHAVSHGGFLHQVGDGMQRLVGCAVAGVLAWVKMPVMVCVVAAILADVLIYVLI